MTGMEIPSTGASSTKKLDWKTIQWSPIQASVYRLQMRIAKAIRDRKPGKAKALQWILTHSFHAKLLAVKYVVQNRGSKTPGIDKQVWKTPAQKIKAACSLKRRGYKTQALRRIYIPKKQAGQVRALSIPTMRCRAQQALHLLALEPIVELRADRNAYGFRLLRSTADAIEQCFKVLSWKRSARYILEGDIQACFESISHSWLLENIPMDKQILRKWLAAGYIEKATFYPTSMGTPQGGIISPALLVLTLSGLESAIRANVHRKDKVNVCIYADDFIITGVTKEVLENKVQPVVESFLAVRGLVLSKQKTRIASIEKGFDFLGMNVRKYNNDKLLITPARKSVREFLTTIRRIIKRCSSVRTEELIRLLNPKIRGWSNYFCHVCSKKTFHYVDHFIFKAIQRWAVRRHPTKGAGWIKSKYFRRDNLRDWMFSTVITKDGQKAHLDLLLAAKTAIRRHSKIKADATPYNPSYREYFDKRKQRMISTYLKCQQRLACPGNKNRIPGTSLSLSEA